MLVDSHCHLQDRKFEGQQDDVIRRARDAGVTAMVCVGYDMESSHRAIDIANTHDDGLRRDRRTPHDEGPAAATTSTNCPPG
jgi:TatD DNase family protein